jgi:hypothetical protein
LFSSYIKTSCWNQGSKFIRNILPSDLEGAPYFSLAKYYNVLQMHQIKEEPGSNKNGFIIISIKGIHVIIYHIYNSQITLRSALKLRHMT